VRGRRGGGERAAHGEGEELERAAARGGGVVEEVQKAALRGARVPPVGRGDGRVEGRRHRGWRFVFARVGELSSRPYRAVSGLATHVHIKQFQCRSFKVFFLETFGPSKFTPTTSIF
jgi:hypothetical protein